MIIERMTLQTRVHTGLGKVRADMIYGFMPPTLTLATEFEFGQPFAIEDSVRSF